jgi:two-component system chemotaxis response regulator CheY
MKYSFLVVDDSPTMRSLVREAFESEWDCEIDECENGFEALKTLPGKQFDLIVVDINMPQINGLELLQFVRSNELHKQTPVIIVTTENAKVDREKGIALGANDYIVKPFDVDDFVERCTAFIGDS